MTTRTLLQSVLPAWVLWEESSVDVFILVEKQ